jgi:hypothetical protein
MTPRLRFCDIAKAAPANGTQPFDSKSFLALLFKREPLSGWLAL